jgi:hypothetical protein
VAAEGVTPIRVTVLPAPKSIRVLPDASSERRPSRSAAVAIPVPLIPAAIWIRSLILPQ